MTMTDIALTTPLVGSLRDLEFRLGVKRADLNELLKSRSSMYQPFLRPKKQHPYPGKLRRLNASKPIKYRRIDNPSKQLKEIQRRILKKILSCIDLPPYMFGAVSGKTLVAHATAHVKNQTSTLVRMDISSYYPNVTCHHVYFVWQVVLGCPPPVARMLTELTTFEWHLPQGAPTSSAIANILLASIYAPVCLASEKAGLTITTWVDDLIFSGPAAREIMETVRATLAAAGFKVAPEKREIFGPRSEKLVTGQRIGRTSPRASHQKMSELRAAIHRLAIGTVDAADIEKYRQNLSARIAHLSTIHEGDAAKLKYLAVKSGVVLK
jgi:RNA-directed DNA polymerase